MCHLLRSLSRHDPILRHRLGETGGTWLTVGGFFAGMLIIALIDKLVPAADNPHEMRRVESMSNDSSCPPRFKRKRNNACEAGGWQLSKPQCELGAHERHPHHHKKKLMRLGLFTAMAIAIHNFPEGIATFVAALENPSLGISIAVAIAIHNIPEGIAVSVPVFYATGDRRKAFRWSLLSGLSEPLGALGWISCAVRHHERHSFRYVVCRSRRYYGIHFPGRAFTDCKRIRRTASFDLWYGCGHGCYGYQPAFVHIMRIACRVQTSLGVLSALYDDGRITRVLFPSRVRCPPIPSYTMTLCLFRHNFPNTLTVRGMNSRCRS